ncbi:GGDEF domain-containing protein [Brucella pseudogrignonensis]|uniref:GGDEF domain-containing protein n=1 Tax=Brucella pseudogrignonensis TaxID=419475 RepID=UPI0028B5BB5A|nr:GGDEF domain-containing protein [Brucella pseudogrignonensis]MDT6941475.1 GGDEF domain-containing protein [Brucella pseudogrignonensis]
MIGLGLRWQAIRNFFGHPSSPVWFIGLTAAIILALLFSASLGQGLVFGFINLAIAAQILAIIIALIYEKEKLPSKLGLILAYVVIGLSSLLRVIQGWILSPEIESLLPADIFLEINLIAATIHISASGAFSLSLAYERTVAVLREIAMRDPLTGLYNRWSIQALMETIQGRKLDHTTSVVMLDIDHFKSVNDTYGHAAGDAALKHCADLIRHTYREFNLIARVGGEEFLVIMPKQSIEEAEKLARKLQTAMKTNVFMFENKHIPLTVSAGISHGSADPLSLQKLISSADKSLYQAKASGRNRIEIDPESSALYFA